MSLINEQQRESAQVDQPNLSDLKITPQPPQPEFTFANQAFTEPESLPVSAGVPISESALQETLSQPADQPLSPDQFGKEDPSSVFDKLPKPSVVPQVNVNLPKADWNVQENQVSPYEPLVINSQLPTLYAQPANTNQVIGQAEKLYQDVISRPQPKQPSLVHQQVNPSKPSPNTPDADKPYTQVFTGWLGDVFLGTERARKETEVGSFNPLAGEWGRPGAGVGGFLKYGLGLTTNLPLAVIGEINKGSANILENLGLSKDEAERFTRDGVLGFLPDQFTFGNPFNQRAVLESGKPIRTEKTPVIITVPKPSNILGFNFDAARKQGNLVQRALTGDSVGDTNDPKASTETNTGRVYFSPRRKPGQNAAQDPLGLAIEAAVNIFNPVDDLNPIIRGFSAGLGWTAKKAGQRIFRRTSEAITPVIPEVSKPTANTSELTQEAISQPYKTIPNLPPAANPTKVTRIENGSTRVIQRAVPPVFDPSTIPPTNVKPVFPVPKSNPAQTILNVGISTPGLRLTDLGSLEVRPYTTIIGQLEESSPKLIENYTGQTWEELKTHVSQFPDVDLSEVSTVGNKLTQSSKDVVVLTKDDLATAAEELAAYKQFADVSLQRLDELFANTVDFGRKPVEDADFRLYTPDEATKITSVGGKLALHPKAYNSIPDSLGLLLKAGDYDNFRIAAYKAGEDPAALLTKVLDENNRILTTPTPISLTKPTKALTQLPTELYHGTALDNWTPAYNLSVNGSRGELGSGLYLTNSKQVAEDYALARVSENVNPKTLVVCQANFAK